MKTARRSNKTFDALTALKQHVDSCRPCIGARKAADPKSMCDTGLMLTLKAANYYSDIIKLRIAAHRNQDGTVYPCPDLSAHGESYAITATACHVTGIQSSLF